jgi:aryl-alcohol dehydrogenase-like predicted oxidoreductase
MERRKLGRSDVEVSRVILGAWAIGGWAWGGTDHKISLRAIQACLEHGVTSIDTAPVYGFGYSEELVGEAIKGKRDQYEILTKCGMRWSGKEGVYYFSTIDNEGNSKDVYKYSGRDSIIRECEESLKRLGTDYIDLYQVHWHDDSTPIDETMEAFQKLFDQGKIRAAGVSNYAVDQLKEAASVINLSTNQLPYSMVRREIEQDTVPWCLQNQCGILAYSPLQRGLLTGKITPETPFAPGDSRPETSHFKINNLIKINQFLDSIRPLADQKGATLAQLVIRWTLQRPGITAALAGARNEMQVAQNAGAAQVSLTSEEMDQINAAIEKLELDPG